MWGLTAESVVKDSMMVVPVERTGLLVLTHCYDTHIERYSVHTSVPVPVVVVATAVP